MLGEVVLTVLAHRPMTGYEIAKSFDQALSHFWHASHQQIYRELARLNRDGMVVYRSVKQSGKPDKKLYAITRAGRTALRKWAAEPSDPPRPHYDLLVKLMAGLLVNKPGIGREFERVQAQTTGYLEQLRAMEKNCLRQPLRTGWDHGLFLALRRGLLLVEAQAEWLAEVKYFLTRGDLKRRVPGRLYSDQ